MNQFRTWNLELGNDRKPFAFSPFRVFAIGLFLFSAIVQCGAMEWVSPDRYRVTLTVDPRGVQRKNSPATVDVDLQKALAEVGAKGTFDENTIEVVGYDASGKPRVFDASRKGNESYLLPWRTQKLFGVTDFTLSFVMPDDKCTAYAVYFDTLESKLGKPKRYTGLVGDGDLFREGYKRREFGPSHFDDFSDWDGDGDLDYFRGGVDPYVYCFENVGGNRFEDRGRLTNEGKLFSLPPDKMGRSWVSVKFFDWDGDGDLDFFPSFAVGYSRGNTRGNTWIYENVTTKGGPLTFADRGPLLTTTGKALGMLDTFAGVAFADLDGDGKTDFIAQRDSVFEFHKNVGTDSSIQNIKLDDGFLLKANGAEIQVSTSQLDLADIDSDGDLDLFCGSQHGRVFWFENVGGKKTPVFMTGRTLVFFEFLDAHSGVKVADFDGDGLLDVTAGRFWERTHYEDQPRFYGRLYKNIGTKTHPRFEPRDAQHGALYMEGFQPCDAVRQNQVRGFDWNGDGRTDLIAADTDGRVWFFRNTTNNLFPMFATGERMMAAGKPIRRIPNANALGYAKTEIADWNNDGKPDLLVLDSSGLVALHLNEGTRTNPKLGLGVDLKGGDVPVQLPQFEGGLCVCDWNSDGKKDLIGSDANFFQFYENTGTDSAPVLAAMKRIIFGPTDDGKTNHWLRPSAGSFLDWDGDGKKDLIAGEFETSIKLYKNIGSGQPGTVPEFADPTGAFLIKPPVGMMIMGADAKDFNGDGDIDILTGQGHGGSGLRFFDRNSIDDTLNNTAPAVTVGKCEVRP